MTVPFKVMCRQFILAGIIGLLILALNSCQKSEETTTEAAPGKVPAPPALTLAPINMSTISVSWTESKRVTFTGFILQRKSSSDNAFKTIANLGSDLRFYSDANLDADQYTYRIYAFNESGNSLPSIEVSVNLLGLIFAPTRLKATSISFGVVKLTWLTNTTNATGYRIERRMSDSTTGTIIDSVMGTATSYLDNTAPCGAALVYRVQAFNDVQSSKFSNYENISTPFTTQSELETGYYTFLNDIGMVDDQIALAVGASGTILRTANGGLSWTKIKPGISNIIYSISCVGNVAYTVGDRGRILKSTDAGLTWTLMASGTTATLYGTAFTDQNTGFVVGEKGILMKTTDGGSTWKLINVGVSGTLYQVRFTSDLTGYVVGRAGTILKTTDGGSTWRYQNSSTTFALRSISFSGDSTGYAVGVGGVILSTTNGGTTWTVQRNGLGVNFRDVHAFGGGRAVIIGERSAVIYTVNGGTSWSRISYGSAIIYTALEVSPSGMGYYVGSAGTVFQIESCQ